MEKRSIRTMKDLWTYCGEQFSGTENARSGLFDQFFIEFKWLERERKFKPEQKEIFDMLLEAAKSDFWILQTSAIWPYIMGQARGCTRSSPWN